MRVAAGRHLAAVVFDFDGVLVESLDIKGRAFAVLYRAYGDQIVQEVVAFHQSHGGVSRFEKIRHFESVLLGLPATQDKIQEKADAFSRLVEDEVVSCSEVSGATDLLRFLSNHLPCFVASATPEQELRRIVQRRGWNEYFSGIFGAPVSKQSILSNIVSTTHSPADTVLMVGDALVDYEAASLAGVRFVGRVQTLARSPFPSQVPLVKDMRELLQVLPSFGTVGAPARYGVTCNGQ